jgi:hypothetical protein
MIRGGWPLPDAHKQGHILNLRVDNGDKFPIENANGGTTTPTTWQGITDLTLK